MRSRMRKQQTLQDLVRVVSQSSHDDHELGLVVADLVNRGVVKIQGPYRQRKVVIR